MQQKISDAEWQVVQLLWRKAPRTANDIVRILEEKTHWNHRTIRTLINRLVKKEIIRFEKSGREYLYYSLVKEENCRQTARKSFLAKVYNGAVQPMLAAFIEETDLSQEEIDALERILREKRSKK